MGHFDPKLMRSNHDKGKGWDEDEGEEKGVDKDKTTH